MRAACLVVCCLAFVVVAACSPPPAPAPPKTEAPATPTTTLPAAPPLTPSANSDLPSVQAKLAGTWSTTVDFGSGKTRSQTLVFRDDGRYEQTDAGVDKPARTAQGTWQVLDGDPAKFTLQLGLASGTKIASTWRLPDATHLVTHVGMSDVVYLRAP
jgi:hypothetical protein